MEEDHSPTKVQGEQNDQKLLSRRRVLLLFRPSPDEGVNWEEGDPSFKKDLRGVI